LALRSPPPDAGISSPDAAAVAGRDVWLVHPWALRDVPADLPPGTLPVGVYLREFHEKWPWSGARWSFVARRLQAVTALRWWTDRETLADLLAHARSVHMVAELHLDAGTPPGVHTRPEPRLFRPIDRPCSSFSQWWTQVTRHLDHARDLPGLR
jgi:deoxyribodipyrimidine photo-lyase